MIRKVKETLDRIYATPEQAAAEVRLDRFVKARIQDLRPRFSHRQVTLATQLIPVRPIRIPLDPLQKVVDGLIRNAVENTPDGCGIRVQVHEAGRKVELVVHDEGIGLTEEAQKRIFEGFFATQETMQYSSKQPFDFNAGGKGADLLRMKIFSERYGFKISMTSNRCSRLPDATDRCEGRKADCDKDKGPACDGSTRVSVLFHRPLTGKGKRRPSHALRFSAHAGRNRGYTDLDRHTGGSGIPSPFPRIPGRSCSQGSGPVSRAGNSRVTL